MAGADGGRTGRRPGGGDTRGEILSSARTLFAERGYSGTSVRAVAAGAGVDAALVHHYFGTKEQLFRDSLQVPMDPAAMIETITAEGPEAVPLRLVQTFLGLWDAPDTGPAVAGFFRRVVAEPETAGAMREFIGESALHIAASNVLADVEPEEAHRRLSLALSQLLGLVIARRLIGLEPLASWPADELAVAVAPTVARYLHGDLTEPVDPTFFAAVDADDLDEKDTQ